MTEESEHYMDHPKVHKSLVTSLDPEPDTQNKHTTRSEPPRVVTTTYSAGAEYIASNTKHVWAPPFAERESHSPERSSTS
jgi:hypothetical protein